MDPKQETIVAIESFQKKKHPSDNLTTERSKVLFHLGYSQVKMKRGEKKSYFFTRLPVSSYNTEGPNSDTQKGHSFEGLVSMAEVAMVRGWPTMAPIKQKNSQSRPEDTCE